MATKILLTDDHQEILNSLTKKLGGAGYDVFRLRTAKMHYIPLI